MTDISPQSQSSLLANEDFYVCKVCYECYLYTELFECFECRKFLSTKTYSIVSASSHPNCAPCAHRPHDTYPQCPVQKNWRSPCFVINIL